MSSHRWLCLVLAASALGAAPAAAAAQPDAPGVFITLPAGDSLHGWQTATITWTHDQALDGGSRQVWWNGEPVASVGYTAEVVADDGSQLMARSHVQVWYGAGTMTMQARICAVDGPCTTDTAGTAVPEPPSVPRAAPVIGLAPHHGTLQDPTRYGSTLSYTTPAYVSLDQPRTLTLLYVSETAFPRNFVQLDVTDNSLDRADVFSLTVLDSSGATRQQTNGGHVAYWRNTPDSARITRMGAQWSMLSVPTGAARFTLVVRSYWEENGTTTYLQSADTVRVPTVNRVTSPYGAGWMVAGVQRLHIAPAGIVVDEGTGAASFFRQGTVGGLVSPTGDRSTLAYDAASTTYRRTWTDGSGIVFNGSGYPLYRYNLLGDTTRYAFSGDRLTAVTDPAGKSFQLFYDAAGKLQRIVDPQGRTAWITVTGGQLTQIIDYDGVAALGNVTYELNASGLTTRRISGWTDRAGGQWNVEYDRFGTPTAVAAPTVTLASGQAARPRTTAVSEKSRLLTGGGVYPAVGRSPRLLPGDVYASQTDARGYTTRIWSDRYGLPLNVVGPLGHGTAIERDTLGNPLSIATPGDTVRLKWTPGGELARTFDESRGIQTDYGYQTGSGGTFLTRSSQGTEEVRYERGARGEVRAVRIGTDTVPVMRYTYDARTRVATAQDAGGHLTELFYDGSAALNTDSVRTVTAAGAMRTSFTYDAHGRTATVRDAAGTVATTGYDDLNRVLRQGVPGDSVRIQYFGADSLVVTDAVGKRYHTAFNRLGWTVSQRDPQGRTTLAAYDSAGNPVRRTDRFGRVFGSRYDALGRITLLTAPDDTIHYGYDNPGSTWVSVRNRESADTVYREQDAGASRTETVMGGERFGVRRARDAQGRHAQTLVWRGNQHAPVWADSTGFEYDARGRLALIADAAGGFTGLRYTGEDQVDRITYPGSLGNLTLAYDALHRLGSTQYSMAPVQGAFGVQSRGYDVLSRLSFREDLSLKRHRRYAYDALGRLSEYRDSVMVLIPQTGCGHLCPPQEAWRPRLQLAWEYDAVGNRTSWTRRDSTAFQTNSFSATLQPSSNRYDVHAGWTLQYDSIGNLVRRYNGVSEFRYGWNSLGQLIAVKTATDSVAYGYNGFGMRVRRTAGGVTTRYLYDGDDLVAEVDASGNRIRAYAYYPGVDNPHSMRTWENGANGAVYYYALELPSNTVRGLFDATGTVAARYDYTPYGEPVNVTAGTTNTVNNPLRFHARELDGTTGLYYVRARWYDPFLGRFMSEDPIGLAGGINNYAYALNDPVNLRDPSGLSPCPPEYFWCGSTIGLPGITVHAGSWGGSGSVPDYYDPNKRNADGLDPLPHHLRYDLPACEDLGCKLREPTSQEAERVHTLIDSISTEGFCGRVRESAQTMVNRELKVWDNRVRHAGGTLLARAPWLPERGGHGLYIWTGALNGWTIAHEAIHGIWNPDGLGSYYQHRQLTPLGFKLDTTAAICTGNLFRDFR